MKHSIRYQIAAVFIGLIALLLTVCAVANTNFLEEYYIKNKQAELQNIHRVIDEALEENTLATDQMKLKLTRLAETGNLSFYVTDADGNVILRTTRNDDENLRRRLLGYLFGKNTQAGEVLAEENSYEILKTVDSWNSSEYIEMWGMFTNGDLFIIRSPLESIRDSVTVANQFLLRVGGVMVIISLLLAWFFSNRITKPILELADLSKKMANLDFEAKYTSGGKNEIGVLGENFNIMSAKLEQSISELKKANNELQKDIEKKEKIEQMRTEFIGNVSHELKTPIALIQGYAEGLKEGVSTDEESRNFYCDVIMDEANKMNQLVKNLLTLNQLEFGNDELEFSRVDLASMIRAIVLSSEILIRQKEVQLSILGEESVYVWADEFKLEQVIRNYLSNALNHAEGERIVEIKIERKEEKVRVGVFNTGKPIPEEDIDKIWDKFYKVDKAHTREYGGNGIGLSIVKAIMESFHQQYGVKNYDNGVEFWFEVDAK